MARVVVWVKIYDNDKEIVPDEEGAGLRGSQEQRKGSDLPTQQEALLAVQVSSRNQGEQVCRELAAYLMVLAKEDPAATAVADTFAREDDHSVKIEQEVLGARDGQYPMPISP